MPSPPLLEMRAALQCLRGHGRGLVRRPCRLVAWPCSKTTHVGAEALDATYRWHAPPHSCGYSFGQEPLGIRGAGPFGGPPELKMVRSPLRVGLALGVEVEVATAVGLAVVGGFVAADELVGAD